MKRFFSLYKLISILVGFLLSISLSPVLADQTGEPGLLFFLSGNNGVTADFSQGNPEPSFIHGVEVIPQGAYGPGFQCAHDQLMAYLAPGNVYAERGTLSFFWRSREPVGKIPFPVFRVSYADHSSWDMAWLRIDYNGHGFDAFVTDVNLGRARVSYPIPELPDPAQWLHIAFSWDENTGVRLYVDGIETARKDTVAVFYAGLDQFGPHSRIISPYQVQSLYNFQRGGDIDEVRIYDRMLSPEHIALLAQGKPITGLTSFIRDLGDETFRREWWLRYGWNRPGDIPPHLAGSSTSVRKVEIHDVYDVKQWFWKGTDGIRETTWPAVYNRSRIVGRTDYFVYPDWNCYSISGKKVSFSLPDEPVNHLEIAGAAYGSFSHMAYDRAHGKDTTTHLFERPPGQERTFHRLDRALTGGTITFENIEQETPIGEFYAYHVSTTRPPTGTVRLSYTLNGDVEPDNPCLEMLVDYIEGRFMPDERSIMVALPRGATRTPRKTAVDHPLPIVHVLVPFEFRKLNPGSNYTRFSYTWENINAGLDGIIVELPPLDIQPTHGDFLPLNIQVKDPIWPDRNLMDFTFSVKPNEAKTLWFDTRDRVLPNGESLYLTFAGASPEFSPVALKGAVVRLVFKDREESRGEHELDRFTQIKDNYSHLVEEHTNIKNLGLYNRLNRDLTDLLRVNPDHVPGIYYWCRTNPEQGWPPFEQPEAPSGTPLWAFRQIEDLKNLKQFILWWIDERMIENGELGGGLSDDGDFSNIYPGAALMGIEPEKITDATLRLMDAYYDQGLFTNGLSTIMADELHSYEEGISVIPQTMLLDYGDPKVVERLMETAVRYRDITGINSAGHRHFRSSYFSGTDIADEGVWEWSKPYNYLILHAGMVLVEFNGNPAAKKLMLELADGLLAHGKKEADGRYSITTSVHFRTDEERPSSLGTAAHLLWAAYRWTGDRKYLEPIIAETDRGNYAYFGLWRGINANIVDQLGKRDTWGRDIASRVTPHSGNDTFRHFAWMYTGNKQYLEEYYADQIQSGDQQMYIMTEGHMWSDRVSMPTSELQLSRLGGVALTRNTIYPGHLVSWDFEKPANDESVAILVRKGTPRELHIIVHNLDSAPVTARMTAWDVEPGKWEVVEGIDSNDDDIIDGAASKRTVGLERTGSVTFTFPANRTTILKLRRTSKAKPYWQRPDLGIGDDDVTVSGAMVTVTVHNIGSVDAPSASLVLLDSKKNELARGTVPPLKAPLDYLPKTAKVSLTAPSGTALPGCRVVINAGEKFVEITRLNNEVRIR